MQKHSRQTTQPNWSLAGHIVTEYDVATWVMDGARASRWQGAGGASKTRQIINYTRRQLKSRMFRMRFVNVMAHRGNKSLPTVFFVCCSRSPPLFLRALARAPQLHFLPHSTTTTCSAFSPVSFNFILVFNFRIQFGWSKFHDSVGAWPACVRYVRETRVLQWTLNLRIACEYANSEMHRIRTTSAAHKKRRCAPPTPAAATM